MLVEFDCVAFLDKLLFLLSIGQVRWAAYKSTVVERRVVQVVAVANQVAVPRSRQEKRSCVFGLV